LLWDRRAEAEATLVLEPDCQPGPWEVARYIIGDALRGVIPFRRMQKRHASLLFGLFSNRIPRRDHAEQVEDENEAEARSPQ